MPYLPRNMRWAVRCDLWGAPHYMCFTELRSEAIRKYLGFHYPAEHLKKIGQLGRSRLWQKQRRKRMLEVVKVEFREVG